MNDVLDKNKMTNQKSRAEHGDEYKGNLIANFSSNVWFGADHEGLYAHLIEKMALVRRYPEEYNDQLISDLGNFLGINPEQLLLTNGTAEGIYLVAQTYRRAKSLIIRPSFSEYTKACKLYEHEIMNCSAELLESFLEDYTPDLVWICSPNNPDGFSFPLSDLKNLVQKYPNVIFILDISFREYCLEPQPDSGWISQHNNIVLLYSFTKRYGIPGLRMGYIQANKEIIKMIRKYAIPWTINTFASETFRYLMAGYSDQFDVREWLEEKRRFIKMIDLVDDFQCQESSTPFFLVKMMKGKSADLKQYLLGKGILIRDASNFFEDGSQWIRLLTLTPEKNQQLVNALQEWEQL